jgi:hypothetical protein
MAKANDLTNWWKRSRNGKSLLYSTQVRRGELRKMRNGEDCYELVAFRKSGIQYITVGKSCRGPRRRFRKL